jgi:phosphatidylglycerophosphate synthase
MKKEFYYWPRFDFFIGKTFSFLSPMAWTWVSFVLAVVAFALTATQYIYWGFTIFLISTLLDAVDGRVARYVDNATYLGAFADGVIDRFVDALVIMCYFYFKLPTWGLNINLLLFLLLFATLLPPFIVAYANHRRAVPDPTETVIWRFAFRVEYLVLLLAGNFFYPIEPIVTLVFLYLSFILNWATVIQAMILAFVKSKNYDQRIPSKK